jgi:hypothetical protein
VVEFEFRQRGAVAYGLGEGEHRLVSQPHVDRMHRRDAAAAAAAERACERAHLGGRSDGLERRRRRGGSATIVEELGREAARRELDVRRRRRVWQPQQC